MDVIGSPDRRRLVNKNKVVIKILPATAEGSAACVTSVYPNADPFVSS